MKVLTLEDVAKVRPAVPSDMKFVYSTWLRDLRHADSGPLPDDIWFPAHREYINRVLSDPKVEVNVLHPADGDEILGYCVAEPGAILHWVQVKPKFRGKHLARRLLEASRALGALAAFSTPDSRQKLKNRRRPRQLRPRYALPSLGCSTTESPSSD